MGSSLDVKLVYGILFNCEEDYDFDLNEESIIDLLSDELIIVPPPPSEKLPCNYREIPGWKEWSEAIDKRRAIFKNSSFDIEYAGIIDYHDSILTLKSLKLNLGYGWAINFDPQIFPTILDEDRNKLIDLAKKFGHPDPIPSWMVIGSYD